MKKSIFSETIEKEREHLSHNTRHHRHRQKRKRKLESIFHLLEIQFASIAFRQNKMRSPQSCKNYVSMNIDLLFIF